MRFAGSREPRRGDITGLFTSQGATATSAGPRWQTPGSPMLTCSWRT